MKIYFSKFKRNKRLFALFPLLLFSSCNFGLIYGLKEIKIDDSRKIYIKRVSRGFSYEAIVLSTNNNYCAEPNEENEYVFNENVKKLYLLDGDILYLLTDLSAERLTEKIPEQGNFPISIKLIDLQSPEAREIISKNKGKTEDLTISNDKYLKCWF